MAKPLPGESAPFYHSYIKLVEGNTVREVVERYAFDVQEFYNRLPEAKADFAYAPGKWTIKQVLQHVTDADRIFGYRALRISRNDATPLPGFDENAYVANGFAAEQPLSVLKQEFNAVRAATDMFLLSLNETQVQRMGTASNNPVTVNALAYIIYGHLLHHKNILTERYGL